MNGVVKPFFQWIGGKGRLIKDIDIRLPHSLLTSEDVTYIEPFVGGGAVLFHILTKYPNIKRVIINDINERVFATYVALRDDPYKLIDMIEEMRKSFISCDMDGRKKMFDSAKDFLNNSDTTDHFLIAAHMLFLNRTSYNGLYRENKRGEFNAPFGWGKDWTLDYKSFLATSKALSGVIIRNEDYKEILKDILPRSFVYLDPPYRPISKTGSFNNYSSEGFGDEEQRVLRDTLDVIDALGCKFLLSNSDCLDGFFDELYNGYVIDRVSIMRNLSCLSAKSVVNEILVRNYTDTRYDRASCHKQLSLFDHE